MSFLSKRVRRTPVRLPADYQETTLANLQYGNAVYVTPWTMEVDEHEHCWINTNATYHREPGGTVSLLVERTPEGWLVRTDTLVFSFQWSPRQIPTNYRYEPVIALDRITEGEEVE